MRTAVDFAVVFACLPFLFGLGLALPALLMGRSASLASAQERSQAIALALAAGLLVNHALGVISADLGAVLAVSGAIALASVGWAASLRGFLPALFGLGRARWALAAAVVLVFCGPILLEPLQAWDARSIWFFHAKRIFYDGGFEATRGWGNPAYAFSHVDYPKLLPLLAAQAAYAAGFWNEYVPKVALLALLAPVVLGLLGAARNVGVGLVLLMLAFLLGGKDLVWNGYVDAYVAAYSGLSLIFFSRWLSRGAWLDLASALVFLGVVLNLKNEGMLIAVCVGAGLLLYAPVVLRVLGAARVPPAIWIALLLAFTGFAVWTATKVYWGAHSDLQLGPGTLSRIVERVGEGGVGVVGLAMLSQIGSTAALVLVALAAALAKVLRRHVPPQAWFPAIVSGVYVLGIFAIYLGTPHDLRWHLTFSVERTLLAAMCGFFASAFLVLEAIDAPQGRAAAEGVEQMRLQT